MLTVLAKGGAPSGQIWPKRTMAFSMRRKIKITFLAVIDTSHKFHLRPGFIEVDAAARIKAPCAAPSKLRNTLSRYIGTRVQRFVGPPVQLPPGVLAPHSSGATS